MRFVRSAERYSEQNLIVRQDQDGGLYFTSTRTINPRQELRVWYSPEYAEARGLKVLRPSPQDLALEDEINSWPCFECSRGFSSSDELQKHLNEHENIAPPNGVIHNNRGGKASSPIKSNKRIRVILPQKEGKS